MIEKIISGGQSGTDQAAINAAIKLGITHGGWMPNGRITEDGLLPERYDLIELPSKFHPQRTKKYQRIRWDLHPIPWYIDWQIRIYQNMGSKVL